MQRDGCLLKLSVAARVALSMPLLLLVAGCNNCSVYEAHSAGGVTVGQRWNRSPDRVESYFCKIPGWRGSPYAWGAVSYGPDCQKFREFSADFRRFGQTYVADIQDGVVVRVGRRSYCIDP